MEFSGKVAIVTGGASGIGASTVRGFVKGGAKVVIADMDSQRGEALAKELGDAAYFIATDVTSETQQQAMFDKTIAHFGTVDIIFANAGIAKDNTITNLSFSDWKKTIDINLSGVYLSCKIAIHYWLAEKKAGVIVNCGSIHSFVGKSGLTAYSASKGGVKLLTQTLAIDYAKQGIRINAICPAYIDTPLLNFLSETEKKALEKLHPQGRLGQPDEVANAVLFLASEKASFINGTSLLVDGGYTAG